MAFKLLLLLAVTASAIAQFNAPWRIQKSKLGETVDKASMKLLQESYNQSPGKNLITAPVGVLLLLAQYSAGAEPASPVRQEIMQYLSSEDYDRLTHDYSSLSDTFGNMNKSVLALANKIYVSDRFTLNENFKSLSVDKYKSDVQKIDFTKPEQAANIINEWASEQTKGYIKEAINPDAIDPAAAVALTNVIFFQGHWHVPFLKSQTQDRDFHVDRTTTVKKPTMYLSQSLFYHESASLGAKMLELPYQEGFRMVVVLPNEIDGLSSVVEKVGKNGLLDEVVQLRPAGRKINLYMPKFDVESYLDLKKILPKVGVSNIFSVTVNGIVNDDVFVDAAFQKAFIKVDEEGAVAGAFTGLVMVPVSAISKPPEDLEVRLDHPFLFTIMYQDTVLFTGVYTQ